MIFASPSTTSNSCIFQYVVHIKSRCVDCQGSDITAQECLK